MTALYKIQNKNIFTFVCYIWVGILCSLAFMPYNLSFLTWIAPFGLFLLEEKYRGNLKKLFLHGTLAGSTVTIISYFWMNHLFVVFGGFPLPIALVLFFLYALITNLRYGIFLILFSILRLRSKVSGSILASFAIIFSEFFTFQIFPYYIGNLIAGDIFLSQVIEYIGIYGLSGVVLFVSFTLFKIFKHSKLFFSKEYFFKIIKFSYPALILVLFSYSLGFYLFHKWNHYPISGQKKIVMVQPNAPLEFRDGRSVNMILDELMLHIEELAIKGSEGISPDLIVLPESGVPFYSAHKTQATSLFHRSYNEKFETLIFLLANRFKTNVFFNELDATFVNKEISRENQRFYNSSSLYNPNGERKQDYKKVYLLGFGEYIPLGETFPILYDILPQVGHFLRGTNLNLITYYQNISEIPPLRKSHLKLIDSSFMNLELIKEYYKEYSTDLNESGKFLPLICYEVIIPEFVRKFRDSGNPDFIVNITNDKWYGPSVESFQHLELARIRSIEYRRWMVRSTNSGTSAFVDHLGRILNNKFTPQEKSDVYSAQIDIISSEPTFYLLYGDLLSWIYLIFVILYIVIKRKRNTLTKYFRLNY
jgi:apolipoprotein N-acyltransferase